MRMLFLIARGFAILLTYGGIVLVYAQVVNWLTGLAMFASGIAFFIWTARFKSEHKIRTWRTSWQRAVRTAKWGLILWIAVVFLAMLSGHDQAIRQVAQRIELHWHDRLLLTNPEAWYQIAVAAMISFPLFLLAIGNALKWARQCRSSRSRVPTKSHSTSPQATRVDLNE